MTLRNISFSELGAAFLSFDGDVLLHRDPRFLFTKNQKYLATIGHRSKSQEVLDESIGLSRDW